MTMYPLTPTSLANATPDGPESGHPHSWLHPGISLNLNVESDVVRITFVNDGVAKDSLNLPLTGWLDPLAVAEGLTMDDLSTIYGAMLAAIDEADMPWTQITHLNATGSGAEQFINLVGAGESGVVECPSDEWSLLIEHLSTIDAIHRSTIVGDVSNTAFSTQLSAAIFIDCLSALAQLPVLSFEQTPGIQPVTQVPKEAAKPIHQLFESLPVTPLAPVDRRKANKSPVVAAPPVIAPLAPTVITDAPPTPPTSKAPPPSQALPQHSSVSPDSAPPRGRVRVRDILAVLAILTPISLLPMLLSMPERLMAWQAEVALLMLIGGYVVGRSKSNRLGQFVLQVKMARLGSAIFGDPLIAFFVALFILGGVFVLIPSNLVLNKDKPQASKGVVPKVEKHKAVVPKRAAMGATAIVGDLKLTASDTTAKNVVEFTKITKPAAGYQWILVHIDAKTAGKVDVGHSNITLVDSAGVSHLPQSGDGVINAPGGLVTDKQPAFWNAGFQIRIGLKPQKLELIIAPTAQEMAQWIFPTNWTPKAAKSTPAAVTKTPVKKAATTRRQSTTKSTTTKSNTGKGSDYYV